MADIHDTIAELRHLLRAAGYTPGFEWTDTMLGPDRNIPAIVEEAGTEDWVPVAYFSGSHGDGHADNWVANRQLIVAMRNALPALLDHIEGCEKSYDYAAKAWAEERARLNERIARLEAKLADAERRIAVRDRAVLQLVRRSGKGIEGIGVMLLKDDAGYFEVRWSRGAIEDVCEQGGA